jgi:hypothetical protein
MFSLIIPKAEKSKKTISLSCNPLSPDKKRKENWTGVTGFLSASTPVAVERAFPVYT